MTRRKQGAPQRLNSQTETKILCEKSDTECPINGKLTDEHTTSDTDCCKEIQESARREWDEVNQQNSTDMKCADVSSAVTCSEVQSTLMNPYNKLETFTDSNQPSSLAIKLEQNTDNSFTMQSSQDKKSIESVPEICKSLYGVDDIGKILSSGKVPDHYETNCSKSSNDHNRPQSSAYHYKDALSLQAAQKLFMDAMLQRQDEEYHGQNTNNWMSIQRSDNNCLSKSKAERYRWCVQGTNVIHKPSNTTTTSQCHVNNLRKSASMAGTGVTPVQDKLYSTVFAGASKFHCRDCGNPFNTLVELTVHMHKTGHFRDKNSVDKSKLSDENDQSNALNGKKKHHVSLDDDAQAEKVLTCMGCGDVFDSLQDLSVHMMKTKHYESVPSLRMLSQKHDQIHDHNSKKKPLTNHLLYSKRPELSSTLPVNPSYLPSLVGAMNCQAAAYASMLYSAPWLASSIPPAYFASLFNSASAGLPYMYGLPPGLFPGSFMQSPYAVPTSTINKSDFPPIKCTHCDDVFDSLDALTEHMKTSPSCLESAYKMGFPCSTDTTSNLRPISSCASPSTTTHTSPTIKQSSPIQQRRNAAPNAGSSKIDPETAYNQRCNEERRESSTSCDFIKSLESTIQSAISKVEVTNSSSETNRSQYSSSDDRRSWNNHRSSTNEKSGTQKFSKPSNTPTSLHSSPATLSSILSRTTSPKREVVHENSLISTTPKTVKYHKPGRMFEASTDSSTSGGKKTSSADKEGTGDSPLDLTLKKREAVQSATASSVVAIPSTVATTRSVSSFERCSETTKSDSAVSTTASDESFTEYAGFKPTKNPLQSIQDNIQTLFSLVTPKMGLAPTSTISTLASITQKNSPVSSQGKTNCKPYRFPTITSKLNQPTNPLQEMLRIVNNTHADNPSLMTFDPITRGSNPRKRSNETANAVTDAKKSKFSAILSDLVWPKDEASNVDPIQMIQDLVNSNTSQGDLSSARFSNAPTWPSEKRAEKSVMTSSPSKKPSLTSPSVPEDRSAEKESDMAPFVSSARSVIPSSPICPKSKDLKTTNHVTPQSHLKSAMNEQTTCSPDEDLVLDASFVQIFQPTSSTLESLMTSLDASETTVERMMRNTNITRDTVKAWLRSQNEEWKSHGRLSFVRCQDEVGLEFICCCCEARFSEAESFCQHAKRHQQTDSFKPNKPDSEIASSNGPDNDTSKNCREIIDCDVEISANKSTATTTSSRYQGAISFRSYPENFHGSTCHVSCVTATSPRENGHSPVRKHVISASPYPDEVISVKRLRHHPRNRCADVVATADDVIRVTT